MTSVAWVNPGPFSICRQGKKAFRRQGQATAAAAAAACAMKERVHLDSRFQTHLSLSMAPLPVSKIRMTLKEIGPMFSISCW